MAAADAGVVHQDIDPPTGRNCRCNQTFPLRIAGHVQRLKARLAPGLDNLRDDSGRFVHQHIRHDDFGAFPGKQQRCRGPHARCRASNDRNLVFQAHPCLR